MRMFHRPENTRVVESEMELLMARAIMRGSRVPRSPKDPDISERGDFRKVAALLLLRYLIVEKDITCIIKKIILPSRECVKSGGRT